MAPSTRLRGPTLMCVFVWAMGLCAAARGAEFAGGTGEPNDPYQIATAGQLAAIWSPSEPELCGKHFVLVASIDLSGTTWPEPAIPVFMGTFDGNGKTIRNLRIDGGSNRGLFGMLWPGAEVRNLGIVDAYVRGAGGCAALTHNNSGRVHDCYSTGTVFGGGATGGLVGYNWGTVANCYSTATVSGGRDVGGLVGPNMGTVTSCHSSGEVTGDSHVGGLAGANTGVMTSSYSVATVTGWRFVGGLVGNNSGKIASCYADATVVGYDRFVGGLVGSNRGAVLSCYSAGSVAGEEHVGGLVGENRGLGKIATSYSIADVTDRSYSWHIGALVGGGSAPDNCYFLAPPDGTGPDNGIGTPLMSVEMKQQASFKDWDFWGTDTDGTADPWFMPEDAYPVLAWQVDVTGLQVVPDVMGLTLDEAQAVLTAAGFVAGAINYDFHRTIPSDRVIRTVPHALAAAGATVDLILSSGATYDWMENPGDGTTNNPYQIHTAGQLESLGNHPELWDRHFVLSVDVDMTGRTYSMALIAPDLDDSATGFQGTPFRGTFAGQGHAIRHLTIRRVDVRHNYVGLFGMVAQGARVESLNLLDAAVEGGAGSASYVGVLAGYNAGTIADCSATGTIQGGKGDGLVGASTTSLVDCHADIVRI